MKENIVLNVKDMNDCPFIYMDCMDDEYCNAHYFIHNQEDEHWKLCIGLIKDGKCPISKNNVIVIKEE